LLLLPPYCFGLSFSFLLLSKLTEALKMLMTVRGMTGSSLGTARLITGYLNSGQEVSFHIFPVNYA
jgi:hypothetical protein